MNNRFSLNDFRHRDDFEDFDDFDDEPIETLDHNTRQRILELLAKGCERREVARRVGLTLNELETAGALDPGFERRMTVAEARFDMRVLIALGEAIRHDKNWQLAAWFLDRGTPPTPLPFALREQLAAARFPEVFDRDALTPLPKPDRAAFRILREAIRHVPDDHPELTMEPLDLRDEE